MERILIVTAFVAAACGSVADRADCAASADCPVGQYCARTADGNVCWADAVAPAVSNVTASCDAPCLRDSVLHVTPTISDATSEVLVASVSLDVGGAAVAMTRSGAEWKANVDLRQLPFEFFSHDVVATVTALTLPAVPALQELLAVDSDEVQAVLSTVMEHVASTAPQFSSPQQVSLVR